MLEIIEPATHARGMRKGQEEGAMMFAIGADEIFEPGFPQERFNRHGSHQEHDAWLNEAQFGVEKGAAELSFLARGLAIAIATGIFPWIAVCERAQIRMLIEIARGETCLLQPALEEKTSRAAPGFIISN